jgi:magnesium-protoporphyrin O-methyltransferase
MDSIIHYGTTDAVAALSRLAERTSGSIVFTFAPRTPLLGAMISVGRLFPRGDRAPWLNPMAADRLDVLMRRDAVLQHWQAGRTERISSGFYKSQALEWRRA